MKPEDLAVVLESHAAWVRGEGGKRAHLNHANLRGANLNRAYLNHANLNQAYLSGASLIGANLRGADLRGADLRGSDLRDAYLRYADLSGADLSGAYLNHANLRGADLRGADLRGAALTGTVLDPAAPLPEATDAELIAAGLEPRTVGGRRYVYGWRTAVSQHVGMTEYKPRRRPYIAALFSADCETACHPGIYLAGLEWLRENYPETPRVRCRCLRSELLHAGDKWRCKRLWILGEEQ